MFLRRLTLPAILALCCAVPLLPAAAQDEPLRVADVVLAGDMDGDGVDDVVVLRRHPQGYTEVGILSVSAEPERRAVLSAHSAVDGAELWTTTVDGHSTNAFELRAARLGPAQRPGVVLLSGSLDDDLNDISFQTGYGAGFYTLAKDQSLPAHATGIGHDGEVLFETVPQRWYVLDGATGAILQSTADRQLFPLGDVDGDGDTDLARVDVLVEPRIVDVVAVDGTPLRGPVEVSRETGYPKVVGDLDGNGMRDLLAVRLELDFDRLYDRGQARLLGDPMMLVPGGGLEIGASLDGRGEDLLSATRRVGSQVEVDVLDGATLDVIVTGAFPAPGGAAGPITALPLGLTDLTGDGHADVLLNTSDGTRRQAVAFDGRSGQWLWTVS